VRTYEPHKITLAPKTIKHIEGIRFRRLMLESYTNGGLDLEQGDKFAANAIWEDDAV
jgi:hypothetical protein